MSNAPVIKEVIRPARKIVSEVVGGGQAPQPAARPAAPAAAAAPSATERRMSRADQAEAAQTASAARARRSGGYRSLLAPSRMENGMKGAARTLGGG
jgi:phage protein D